MTLPRCQSGNVRHPFSHFSLLSQARPLYTAPLRHGNINSQPWKYHVTKLCLPIILLIWAIGPLCSTDDLAWTCRFAGACYPSYFNPTGGPCSAASLVTVCRCCIVLLEPYPTTETSEIGAVVEDLIGAQYQNRPWKQYMTFSGLIQKSTSRKNRHWRSAVRPTRHILLRRKPLHD